MKKSIYLFIIAVLILFMILVPVSTVKAASLDNLQVEVSKAKVEPGQEVTVTTNFGKNLGAYTVDVAYDNNLFEYVRSEGGTENDNGTRVRLTYYDTTGGTTPRTNAKVTFKAKENIVTSNPTDFAITLEGLSNADASETYDDITTPIKKDVLVEPNYVDYNLTLNYTGTIEPKVAKDMTLITSSSMGKNYDHVRLIAEIAKEPSKDATTKLIAINDASQEIDLIQNGWGDAAGYSIGGKNVKQELKLKGEFSTVGDYTIHIKLIDRDNSDSVIVEKSFNLKVAEKQQAKPDTGTTNKPNNTQEKLPESLPKTGNTQYVVIFAIIAVLAISYYFLSKRNQKN
ncbi:MAG: LPXTG cell wall anchor domain-containing protein [Clostridia bacterium]|nr:LPXTG cell wall anchor domain-containing protein [Clostridia bacterium]